MRHKPLISPGLVLGTVILAAGIILFLDRLDILEAREVFRFWPMALIALGIARLVQPGGAGRVWGFLLVFFGALLQFDRLGYERIGMHELWPLVLVAVGLLLLWNAIEARRGGAPARSLSMLNAWAILGGGELRNSAQDFQGGEVLAIFGGYNVDLRQAAMAGDEAVIYANALFGGVEIKVPESWSVSMQGVPILGGYSDQSHHPKLEDGANVKRLIVKGLAMFGGVEVKN